MSDFREKLRDYTKQIREFWPTIMQAWEEHADKRPVIECDIVNKQVRAYASDEYINSLSERTRETARQEFAHAMDEGNIMVFVMDSKHRVLQSYRFPIVSEAPVRKPIRKPNPASKRIAHPQRVRKR